MVRVSTSRLEQDDRITTYLREMSCSRMLWRPRSAKSKLTVRGYLGLVRMACVQRRRASEYSML
jgi:hypothetical protein